MGTANRSRATRITALSVALLILVALVLWSLADAEPHDRSDPAVLTASQLSADPALRDRPSEAEAAPVPLDAAEVVAVQPPQEQARELPGTPTPDEVKEFRVVVIDQRARPVPDATVEIRRRPETRVSRFGFGRTRASDLELVRRLTTDALGRCTIGIAREKEFVLASRPGVGRSRWTNSILLGKARTDEGDSIMVLEPELLIEGVVLTAEGHPAPDVPVTVVPTKPAWSIVQDVAETLSSGPDGRFRLTLLPPSAFLVVATSSDERVAEVHVEAPTGTLLELTLRLPGDWWIDGVVLDAQGTPRPGLTVLVFPGADLKAPWEGLDPEHGNLHSERVTTGAGGSFSYRAKTLAPHVLVATEDRASPSEPLRVDLDASRPRQRVTLQLTEGEEISGRLRTAIDAPLANAAVALVKREPAWLKAVPKPTVLFFPAPEARWAARRRQTDADGRFSAEGLYPHGTYDLLVLPPGVRRGGKTQRVAEGVPAGTRDLDLIVRFEQPLSTGLIRAMVRSAATGEPVEVSAVGVAEEGKVAGAVRGAGKDNGGQVVVDGLVSGQAYTLSVSSKGLASVDVHDLIAGEDPEPIAIALPATAALLVEVTDARGLPLPYVKVRLKRSYDGAGHHHPQPRFADAAGRVRFDNMDPGSYRVSFERDGQSTEATIDVTGGATGHLILAADGG